MRTLIVLVILSACAAQEAPVSTPTFRLGVQHPAKVRRLVIVSAGFARDGYYPEMLPMQAQVGAAMADLMKDTPMYKSYAAIAPDPAVKRLSMPVMLVFGDSDMFRLDHVVEFYRLLGGGLRDAGWKREHMATNRLAILPDLTHYEVFSAR